MSPSPIPDSLLPFYQRTLSPSTPCSSNNNFIRFKLYFIYFNINLPRRNKDRNKDTDVRQTTSTEETK